MTNFNSNFDKTYPFSDTGAKLLLAASTELTWTVPGDATQKYRATFSFAATSEVWVALNGTATLPSAGTVSTAYNQELNPNHRYVKGGDVLHFISSATPQVCVSLLAIPG